MADKRVELKEETLDDIFGGITYTNVGGNYIWANNNENDKYQYDDLAAVRAVLAEYRAKYTILEEYDKDMIAELLKRGLIYK